MREQVFWGSYRNVGPGGSIKRTQDAGDHSAQDDFPIDLSHPSPEHSFAERKQAQSWGFSEAFSSTS